MKNIDDAEVKAIILGVLALTLTLYRGEQLAQLSNKARGQSFKRNDYTLVCSQRHGFLNRLYPFLDY